MSSEAERWHIRDRYYGVTLLSAPDSYDLELDDLGPGVGRGQVAVASTTDGGPLITLTVLTDAVLPIEVVEQFIAEARNTL